MKHTLTSEKILAAISVLETVVKVPIDKRKKVRYT